MTEAKFNAAMLTLARCARDLTQAEAARESGVTQALISKIENNLISTPSEDVVQAFADALKFPVEFFYQNERALGFPHFHHRKRSRLGVKVLNRIEADINIKRQHIIRLLKSYETNISRPIPQIDLENINSTPAKLAEKMREYWVMPRGPVQNMVELIESAGGIVILCDFGTSLLDGISFRLADLPPLFFMNKNVPADRFRFSLAHELGHMIMHNIPEDDDTLERQADEFAGAFLMPPQEVRPYLVDASIAKLARAKPYWLVSIKALIRRSYELKLITPHQYKMLCIEYNKAGYASGEPLPLEYEQPTMVGKMIDHHIQALNYTPKELSKILLLQEEEFCQHYIPQPKIRLIK